MIEIVTGKGRAPLPQDPREPSSLEIGLHLILVDVRETLARQGCLPDQVGVVEHEGTVHANREGATLLLEVPGVEAACPDLPVVDAALSGELAGRPGHRVVGEIRW